jgi:hypothetical protein
MVYTKYSKFRSSVDLEISEIPGETGIERRKRLEAYYKHRWSMMTNEEKDSYTTEVHHDYITNTATRKRRERELYQQVKQRINLIYRLTGKRTIVVGVETDDASDHICINDDSLEGIFGQGANNISFTFINKV